MPHLGLDFYSGNLESPVKNLYFHTFESPKYPRCPKSPLGPDQVPASIYEDISILVRSLKSRDNLARCVSIWDMIV